MKLTDLNNLNNNNYNNINNTNKYNEELEKLEKHYEIILEELDKVLFDKEHENETITAELTNTKDELKIKNEEIKTFNIEKELFVKRIYETTMDLDDLNKSNENLKEINKTLTTELENLKVELESLKNSYAREKKKLESKLNNAIEKLNKEIKKNSDKKVNESTDTGLTGISTVISNNGLFNSTNSNSFKRRDSNTMNSNSNKVDVEDLFEKDNKEDKENKEDSNLEQSVNLGFKRKKVKMEKTENKNINESNDKMNINTNNTNNINNISIHDNRKDIPINYNNYINYKIEKQEEITIFNIQPPVNTSLLKSKKLIKKDPLSITPTCSFVIIGENNYTKELINKDLDSEKYKIDKCNDTLGWLLLKIQDCDNKLTDLYTSKPKIIGIKPQIKPIDNISKSSKELVDIRNIKDFKEL